MYLECKTPARWQLWNGTESSPFNIYETVHKLSLFRYPLEFSSFWYEIRNRGNRRNVFPSTSYFIFHSLFYILWYFATLILETSKMIFFRNFFHTNRWNNLETKYKCLVRFPGRSSLSSIRSQWWVGRLWLIDGNYELLSTILNFLML